MQRIIYKKFFVLLLLSLVCSTNLSSQTNEGPGEIPSDLGPLKRPSIGGHTFSIPSEIRSPFINTSIQIFAGIGQTSGFELPPLEIDSVIISQLKGDLVFTTFFLEYQVAVRDWLAFNADLRIKSRIGTETRSLIAQGLNVSAGYQFGWLFKLYQSKKSMLSGSLNVSNENYTVVDLEEFVRKIIESGTITSDNRLVQTVPSLNVTGGLNYALALNKSFGMVVFLEGGYGESVDRRSEDQWITSGGVSIDYDLMPGSKVPLGFALAYYQNSTPILSQERVGNPQNAIAQISYTGRNDLDAGIEISYEWSKPKSFDTRGKYLQFINIYGKLKYYF